MPTPTLLALDQVLQELIDYFQEALETLEAENGALRKLTIAQKQQLDSYAKMKQFLEDSDTRLKIVQEQFHTEQKQFHTDMDKLKSLATQLNSDYNSLTDREFQDLQESLRQAMTTIKNGLDQELIEANELLAEQVKLLTEQLEQALTVNSDLQTANDLLSVQIKKLL